MICNVFFFEFVNSSTTFCSLRLYISVAVTVDVVRLVTCDIAKHMSVSMSRLSPIRLPQRPRNGIRFDDVGCVCVYMIQMWIELHSAQNPL